MQHLLMQSGTSYDVVGNTEGATTYYQHETGTDQVKSAATATVAANIESGDFDITQKIRRHKVVHSSEEMVNLL